MDLTKEIRSDEEKHTLHSEDSAFSLSLRVGTFHSEKEFDKFIKNSERLVRSSGEYKRWIAYIIDVLGYTSCALTEEDINECNVEIHHHPITLYTICKSVVSDLIRKDIEFCSFDVATKVIELHFQNKIGYLPLLSDLHKKYHNGYLEIPIGLIHGDYKHLLKNFIIDDDEKDKIYALCAVKQADNPVSWKRDEYPGSNKSVGV